MYPFFFKQNNEEQRKVSSVQNPGWLFDIVDYTTQLYGDYNKRSSLETNQYNGMS